MGTWGAMSTSSYGQVFSNKGFPEMNTTPSASPGLLGSPESMNGVNGTSHMVNGTTMSTASSTKAKIFELSSYSSKLETILLELLNDHRDLLEKFDAFRSIYDRDKDEQETALHNLNDRLVAEVDAREASDKSHQEALDRVQGQCGDLVNALDQKLSQTNRDLEDANRKNDEKVKNLRDEMTGKIQQSSNDLQDKMRGEVEAAKEDVSKVLNEKIDAEVDGLKGNLDEMERNVGDLLNKERGDREKGDADLKMALEEEKMLRAQDTEILKFNLNEGMKEIKDSNEA